MRKWVLLSVSAILMSGLIACSNQDGKKTSNASNTSSSMSKSSKTGDVREVVWNQLPQERKDLIRGTWRDAEVSTFVLTKDTIKSYPIKDTSYMGREIQVLYFTTNEKKAPNNMLVYADKETLKIIGYGVRE